jgi:ATP/maltotriose-dependent transcriptional regulator MalT
VAEGSRSAPIVRRAVYESAPPAWRIGAHARVAALLDQRGAPPAALAHHIQFAAQKGDERAIAVLSAAGHEAAPRAPDTAARWYSAALRLLPEQASPERSLELLIATAASLGATGRLDESLARLLQALELMPPEQAERRVELIAFVAQLEHMLGRHQQAQQRVSEALAGGDPTSLADGSLALELALGAVFQADFDAVQAWSERALSAACAHGDRALEAAAGSLRTFSDWHAGRWEAAGERLTRAAALVNEATDEELARRLQAPYMAGWTEHFMVRYDDSIAHLRRGIAVARRSGQGALLVPMRIGLSLSLAWRGRLAEALTEAEAAVDGARLQAVDQSLAWALAARSYIATQAGDLGAARAAGEESLRLVPRFDESVVSSTIGWVLGHMLVEGGEPELASEAILARGGGPELTRFGAGFRPHVWGVLVRAALARGALSEAEELTGRAEETARRVASPLAAADAQRARAAVLLAVGEPAAAAERALASAASADQARAEIEAARSRALAGRALAAAGEREEALAQLERARVDLERLGARRFADEAARELRRLGRHVPRKAGRRRGGEAASELTVREREIVDLVVRGRTNRQIAADLHLSEKTIESHMARIFRKLGVSKRSAIPARLESG